MNKIEEVVAAMAAADIAWVRAKFPDLTDKDIAEMSDDPVVPESYTVLARAAIAAMEKPTEGMVAEGRIALLAEGMKGVWDSDVKASWSAMIRAAQSEDPS